MTLVYLYARDFGNLNNFKIGPFTSDLTALFNEDSCIRSDIMRAFAFVIGGQEEEFEGRSLQEFIGNGQNVKEMWVQFVWKTENDTELTFRRRLINEDFNKNSDNEDEEELELLEEEKEVTDDEDSEDDSDEDIAKEKKEEEEDDEEDDEEEDEEDTSDYWLNGKKVTRRLYMKAIKKLGFYFNGQMIAVFNTSSVPKTNKMICEVIEKYSGSKTHAKLQRKWQKELNKTKDLLKSLDEKKKKLEVDKLKCQEYFILKLYTLDHEIEKMNTRIANQQRNVNRANGDLVRTVLHKEKLEKLKGDHRALIENRIKVMKISEALGVMVLLEEGRIETLPRSVGYYTPQQIIENSLLKVDYSAVDDILGPPASKKKKEDPYMKAVEKYTIIQEELPELNLEVYQDCDYPVFMKKAEELQKEIQKAEEVRGQQQEKFQKAVALRRTAFNNLFLPVSAAIDDISREMWGRGSSYERGARLFTANEQMPWKDIQCEKIEQIHFAEFMSCSTGERRMIYTALVIAILRAAECPMVFFDDLDLSIAPPAFSTLMNFLTNMRQTPGKIAFGLVNKDYKRVLREFDVPIMG